MIKKLFLCLVVLTWFGLNETAHAHVLLKDSVAGVGAMLHINPDDDPIAGERTVMYIDIQNTNGQNDLLSDSAYDFFITSETGERQNVPISVDGNISSVTYVFPVRGLYSLELVSSPDSDSSKRISMSYSLRVSRGAGVSTASTHASSWASIGLVVSATCFALLAILAFNNRKEIMAYSKL